MNKYIKKQAEDFCRETGTSVDIVFAGNKINDLWGDGRSRNSYDVTIKTQLGEMELTFWDSIHNTTKGNIPTTYDILSCIVTYDPGTFQEFISGYGYDPNDERTEEIYKAVVRQWEDIERIFTEEQIEMLRWIV